MPKTKNTINTLRKEKILKILGCLPSSVLFNVVISTSLNLNVPEITGLHDSLWHYFWCAQMNGLLARMKLTPKVWLQPLCVNLKVLFSGCIISAPPCAKTLVTVNGPDHRDFNFPRKSLSRELNKRTG